MKDKYSSKEKRNNEKRNTFRICNIEAKWDKIF